MTNFANIAVQGCCHGELDTIYQTIRDAEQHTGEKVDLLLICGDFQSVRSAADLEHMAVPPKYRSMNTFHEYVVGLKVAPVLTVFVGGNHEASNVLQDLYYGGERPAAAAAAACAASTYCPAPTAHLMQAMWLPTSTIWAAAGWCASRACASAA